MKVLVTGGSGFIGTAMVAELLKRGHEPRILDIKPSPHKVECVIGDITDPAVMDKAVSGCDAIIHLAAVLGVEFTDTHPVETLSISIDGIKNLLDSARKHNVKRVVFSSSSEVYGEPLKLPITEDEPLKPKSVYGVGKLVAEWYLKSYSKQYGVPYTIIRFFNVYGPHQGPRWVMPKFVSLAVKNEPLMINGAGDQTRAFCFVGDAACGTVSALMSEKAVNEEINIGNGTEPVTMKSLAERVVRLAGSRSEIKFVPFADRTQEREIQNRAPDTAKAKRLLGYEPAVMMDAGIKETVEWFKGVSNVRA